MRMKHLLAALTLGAALSPGSVLAQGCLKIPATITCPEGHVWDAASLLCLPLST